jgi:hypothetical protein
MNIGNGIEKLFKIAAGVIIVLVLVIVGFLFLGGSTDEIKTKEKIQPDKVTIENGDTIYHYNIEQYVQ